MSASTTSQHIACEFVKRQLLQAALLPGQRVIAGDLAAKLGISRTPVREALGRLEHEQLVTRDAAGGYTVRTFSIKEIVDLYKVREALEVESMAEAMENLDDQALDQLRAALDAAQKEICSERSRKFIVASRRFHELITLIGANVLLQEMLGRINDKVQIIGALMFRRDASAMQQVMDENRAILAAMSARNEALGVEAVRTHVRNGKRRILKVVTDGLYC